MPYKVEEKIEPGMRIGKLTVLGQAEEKSNRGALMWRVRCDCGNELIGGDTALRRHNLRSCGCSDGHEDLTGQKFGMLMVLKKALNDPAGKTQWLCKCDCGNETTIRVEFLKTWEVPSCGCYASKQKAAPNITHGLDKHPLAAIWRTMKWRAKEAGDQMDALVIQNRIEPYHYEKLRCFRDSKMNISFLAVFRR